jgi:endo-1,3(4)-beta-glucanase
MAIKIALLACTLVLSSVFAQSCPTTTPNTSGAFADVQPPYASHSHPMPPTSTWGTLQAPYPTNQFFTNIFLSGTTDVVVPHPYMMNVAATTGLAMGYPGRQASASGIIQSFVQNINIAAAETLSAKTITSYDPLTVTVQWNGASGVGSLSVPIIRGNPLPTFFYNNLTPRISTIHAIISVNGQGSGSTTGSKFVVSFNNGQTWVIYVTNGASITLNWSGNTLTAAAPFTGSIRVGDIPSGQATTVFDTYAATIPTGVKLNFYNGSANEQAGYIEFAFQTIGTGLPSNLLIMALPHHVDCLASGNTKVLAGSYQTMKGLMTGFVGSVWRLREALTPVVWSAPSGVPASKKQDIINALNGDQYARGQSLDPYWGGKSLAKMARLALIADEVGQTAVAASIRANLKADLAPWFLATNTDPLYFDSSYGGTVSKNGLADAGADYGNGYYNDHHFHYGYFAYAAAVVGKADPAWLAANKQYIMPLVRDFASPVRDTHFPQARHKDWYDGHSWAAGLFQFGDAKNQESSSECINAYYGVYLLGVAFNDPTFTFWGQMLLMTEIRSAQKYWQITNDNPIYESVYAANKVVGVLWASKVDYTTFFGNEVEYIHGIQMLPYTPISEVLLRPKWIQEEYPVVSQALTRANPVIGDDWKGFVLMAHAIIAPNTAWTEVQSLNDYDSGNSKTNVLYWVATRPGFSLKRSGSQIL